MLSVLRCRLGLAGFRWVRVSIITRLCFVGSLMGLAFFGSYFPLEKIASSPWPFIGWVMGCLFLVFLALFSIGSFRQQAKEINKANKAALNQIRRRYGQREKE